MFNPYTKFGVFKTICNEDVKGNAKNVKILVLRLGVTYMFRLWLVGNSVVNFLLELIELLSLAITVEAL